MTGDLYSVEQVADRLDLHVKTVRSYVRSGRLKATRIGKQYRIAREDLEAMTGKPATSVDGAATSKQRHVEVSSIVEIEAISPESVSRVTNMLLAATSTRSQEGGQVRVETIYDERRGRLKIIVVGSMESTAELFRLIGFVLNG
jgi:excisionase family DNA binding protein